MKTFNAAGLYDQLSVVVAVNFGSPAGFQRFQDAYQSIVYWRFRENPLCNIFLPLFRRGKILNWPAKLGGAVLYMACDGIGDIHKV